MRKKKNKKIQMSAYRITPKVRTAYILGTVSVIGLLGLCIYSAVKKGDAGLIAGIIPIIMMLLNIVGLTMAYSERTNEDIKPKHIFISSAINGVLVIMLLMIYIFGMIASVTIS